MRGGPNLEMALRGNDILVVPEFMLSLAQEAFPTSRKIILVQNPFSYLTTFDDTRQRGIDPYAGVLLSLGVSQMCLEAIRLTGAGPDALVTVGPDFGIFEYRSDKKMQIAYMPRKRRAEARVVIEALRRGGKVNGFDIVEVEGKPQASVARILSESMFFISFLKRESLGFPAMEAMASGCVVVGYTGTGGREYFDAETGIPVAEDDTAALVRAVEDSVEAYRADPRIFDELRRRAAGRVTERYAASQTTETLLSALRGVGLLSGNSDTTELQEAS